MYISMYKQRTEWVYTHTVEYCSAFKKESNSDTHYNMGKPWKHQSKWKEPHKRTKLVWFHLCEVHQVIIELTSISLFTFHFHALEKEMATHSSVLAWRIPGTGEPDGLPSMGSHRVGHDWSNLAMVYPSLYLHFYPSDFFLPFKGNCRQQYTSS